MEDWILDTIQDTNTEELSGIQGEDAFIITNDWCKLVILAFPKKQVGRS